MGQIHLLQPPGKILLADGSVYQPPRTEFPITVGREYDVSPPEWINPNLKKRFGTNWLGEPRYRIVWGWQRMAFFGGVFDVYSDDGSHWLRNEVGVFLGPKYDYIGLDKLERWIIEKWVPAEAYGSPEDWYEQTSEIEGCQNLEGIGPYPSRGEYELSWVIEDALGNFVYPTEEIVNYCCDSIELANKLRNIERRNRVIEEERKRQESFKGLAGDIWDDARVAFNGCPNTTQANTPEKKGRILQFTN